MRVEISELEKKIKINKPKEIASIFQRILAIEEKEDRAKEHFWGIYLNSRGKIIRIDMISLGVLNANIVHPRETFSPAITSKASAIIVAHNHPTSDSEPSEADILVTHRLKEAGKILGIELLDHIIITEDESYYSFRENKLLK